MSALLAYSWAARVLPCRFGPARSLFGPSDACPVPIVLLGHDSFVPAVLLGALVVCSAFLFAASFVGIAIATWRVRRSFTKCHTDGRLPLGALPRGLSDPDCVVVIADEAPVAYCIGLFKQSVVLSSGLIQQLSLPALRAVVEPKPLTIVAETLCGVPWRGAWPEGYSSSRAWATWWSPPWPRTR